MSELKYDCTEIEHIDWVLENQKHAGGFEYNLIEAWRRADGENKRRLEEAFPYDYRIPLGKPQQTREEWLDTYKAKPLERAVKSEEQAFDDLATHNERFSGYGEED